MKKTIIILILSMFACKSGKEAIVSEKNVLLHYSKGPCLGGRCPVYDLYIYDDGKILYRATKGLKSERERQGQLSSTEIADLTIFLQTYLEEPTPLKKVRDLPVTNLKFAKKQYKYHASKINGKLKTVNSKIETLVTHLLNN